MANYVTPDTLRDYIGSDTTNFAGVASAVCTVASRWVEEKCNRYFTQDSTATARDFPTSDWHRVCVNDISTTTGLLVATDDSLNGTFSTSWTIATDFTLAPVNPSASGITVPYTEIIATGTSKMWPISWSTQPNPLRVTAKWGWAAVPDAVIQATLIKAAQLFKMKDAADGYIGVDGWGPVRVREPQEALALLGPYMKYPVAVA